MDRLNDKINEFNDLYDTNKWSIYFNKKNTFFSKINNLPYSPTSEDSQEEIAQEPEESEE
jgi:hypothetical protein